MPPKRRGNPKASSLSSRKPSRKQNSPNPATASAASDQADNPIADVATSATYQEPPVLDQPSYMEYKGTPRFNVLDDMQPLGTLPTNAVKLRVKAPKPPEALRPNVRLKKAGISTAKEHVESAESSQPSVPRQSTESFHPMITRKRNQSHKPQGETIPATRPASRMPQNPVDRPRRSASRKPQDPIQPPRRSPSQAPRDLILPPHRSASRKPQALLPPTHRSQSRKPQDVIARTRRSASQKPQEQFAPIHRSASLQPLGSHRRSRSRKIEDRNSITRRSQSRKLENRDNIPEQQKAAPAAPSAQCGPSSRTAAGQILLKQVVDAAVQRSIDLGNPVIGLAIKKLYEESLHDRKLADLLDGVLSQEPTPQQTTDFQAFIKVARKQIKSETGSARHSSQSTRPSSSRRTGAVKDSFDASGKSKLPPKTDNPSSLPQDIITATENISTNEGNPPKRRKTSRSVSTSSSLSSLPSIDQDLSLLTKGDQASASEPTINSLPVNQPLLRSKRKPISAAAQQFIDSIPSINSIPRRPDLSLSDEEEQLLNEEEEYQKTKGSLRKAFPDFKTLDSNIRDEPHPSKRPQVLSAKPKPAFILTQPRPPTAASRKRKHDDDDNIHSPTSSHGELLIQPPPGARATSRGATPNPSGRPTKRIKAARVKMSPVKKKSGITGTGRTGVRKGAKLNYAEELEVDNNEDACTACGGNGKLLCCDKCPSAFHFSCVDPPLDEDNPPEGEWLCNKCKSKHDHPTKKSRGLFSSLMENIEKQNPSIFSLPYELRDRYEGVKTGEKGEYQEYTDVGTKIKAKTFDEAKAELLKLKDKAGKTILCYHCRGSALGGRPIISCDYCPLKWHLDCLDPPLAAPPVKQPSGNPRHTWMCPNHVDHELRAIDKSIRAAGESNPAGKVFKLRKPKRAKYIEPAISRGLPNNGLIDIINEPSDDEGPTIFRIAEKGLKLDFITKMKKTIEEEARREPEGRAAVNEAFDKHSFIDRQAALNLAQFALANQDLGLTPASVGELTHALIAEAPANVASLITREEKSTRLSTIPEEESTDAPVRLAPSSPPAEKSTGGTEKQSLELLQELIRRRLEAGGFLG